MMLSFTLMDHGWAADLKSDLDSEIPIVRRSRVAQPRGEPLVDRADNR